jgi:SNF2 family DNA or RNA helicase
VFPALVVCPNGVKYVWEREFARWWPEVRVQVVTGGAVARRKQLLAPDEADVFVINYESVRLHSRLAPYGSIALQRCCVCEPTLDEKEYPQRKCEWCRRELNEVPYQTVIVDEAHRMKDPKSKQTRAVWSIMHGKQVRSRFGMTGTPIANNLADLWAIMHGVSPTEFPTKTKFVDRYVLKGYSFFGGMEILGVNPVTRDELFKILDPRTRRLPKEVILPQLPPKVYSVMPVEMSARQAKAYRQMEKHMVSELEDGILIAKNPLVKVGRLMQFASAYAEIDEEGNIQLSEPSNKIDALVELLDDLGDEPLVVFSASKQLIKLAAARLDRLKVTYGLATGDQTVEQRQRAVDRFQSGDVRCVLGTIDAAGEGLTMTRTRHLCFLQRHWSALKNKQAEDRAHRIGSEIHDRIEIIDIISLDTVEQRQRERLGDKLARLEEVVRDREMLALLLGIES